MFGNDFYPGLKLGLNKHVPFRSYVNDEEPNYHDINVVFINDPKERMQCIVVEKDGRYADFYYNGAEENFKQLTEAGYEENSWELEECGTTPDIILQNGIDEDLVHELIEYDEGDDEYDDEEDNEF